MRFVVTGCPRSATGYASLLLQALGVPCSHEAVAHPRAGLLALWDWYRADNGGESSWLSWTILGALPDAVPVLHTVRNPWQVVDSLAHRNDILPKDALVNEARGAFRTAVATYCPEVLEYDSDIDRAAAMVVRWNRLIECTVDRLHCPMMRYRVEDIDEHSILDLCEFLGFVPSTEAVDKALLIPRNVNAGKRIEYNVPITNPVIADIVRKAMHASADESLAVSYGFTTDIPRSPAELEADMNPSLREQLNFLAAEYGYSRRDHEGETEWVLAASAS